jgi:hypothetical protein
MAGYLQIAGALLVLCPFAWSQLGSLRPASYAYLCSNFAGSATLATLALLDRQWGFLLLEGSWAFVSAWGLMAQTGARLMARRETRGS